MGFFRSVKEKFQGDSHEQRDDLNPQQGQKQSYQSPEVQYYDSNTTRREKQEVFGEQSSTFSSQPQNTDNRYQNQYQDEYTAPPGPPPSHQQHGDQPQQWQQGSDAPKQMGHRANPPPYQDHSDANEQPQHPWQSVPDTSEFPPPPAVHDTFSPTNNASEDSAEAGYSFCVNNPIYMPAMPNKSLHDKVHISGDIDLQVPPGIRFQGKFRKESLSSSHFRSSSSTRTITRYSSLASTPAIEGVSRPTASKVQRISSAYTITSPPSADDICFTTGLPMYFAKRDNPLINSGSKQPQQQTPKEISFAVKINSITSDRNAVIGIGFVSKPYPPFRQPGWHRGSLGIHADDGRKYINDPDGGIEFVRPFQDGDLIVVTMTFYPVPSPSSSSSSISTSEGDYEVSNLPKCRTRVEFERNGVWEGGWDMHEERDADRPGIQGLQGEGDLYAAVGACGGCGFEVLFWPQGV